MEGWLLESPITSSNSASYTRNNYILHMKSLRNDNAARKCPFFLTKRTECSDSDTTNSSETTKFMKAKKLNQSRMCRNYDKSTHSAPNGASVGSNDAPGRWRVCGGECARRWGPAEEQLCVQLRRGEQRKCTKGTCGIRSSAVEPSTWGSLDNPTELSSTTIRFVLTTFPFSDALRRSPQRRGFPGYPFRILVASVDENGFFVATSSDAAPLEDK